MNLYFDIFLILNLISEPIEEEEKNDSNILNLKISNGN